MPLGWVKIVTASFDALLSLVFALAFGLGFGVANAFVVVFRLGLTLVFDGPPEVDIGDID